MIEAIECLKSLSLAGFGFAGFGLEIKEMENTLKALQVYTLGPGQIHDFDRNGYKRGSA